jgi:prolyl-tRNA editing enzyme YbaK/EbsC (Cys-tRNA(Pro) deacylase)
MDVRKASFLSMDEAVERTSMEYGGITPVGLPEDWRLFVDESLTTAPVVIVGSGVRRSKILLPGAVLAALPGAEVVAGLGI